ncbi:hypothetical protein Dcar01_02389 [Deinococcus carri]|uniref:Uncharacterized protein n=1 Tax=Deinococcus carri TaxID=1211323 RepID=A0ABP9W8H4_9DEIO
MSALAIRRGVEAALAEAGVQVGTYRFPDGQEAPAIRVGDPPEGTTVTGLEVLISPNPKRQNIEAFIPLGIQSYSVRLLNRAALPDVLEEATNAIAQRFWPFDDEPRRLDASSAMPEQVGFSLLYDPTDHPTP